MEVFKSLNGGSSWNLVNNWWEYYGNPTIYLHADIPDIQFILDPNENEFVFISTDGGLYISYDGLDEVLNLSENGLDIIPFHMNGNQSMYLNILKVYRIYSHKSPFFL